jgi:SAM-dependent methyltransferase
MARASGQDKFDEARFWDKVASQRVYAAFDQNEYETIIDRCLGSDLSGITVVDIGSASGVSAALFAARGAKVIGVDISPDLVSQAKSLWKEYADRIDFMVGDAENLDLPDQSADVVFFGGVLHHFPVRDKVYDEAIRLLRAGGRFIAIEPNRLDYFERIEWAVADLRGKLAPSEYPIDPRLMREDLLARKMTDVVYWTTRSDIPVLNQFPILRHFFSRQRGFAVKQPILRFVNAFRSPEARGTFFVINGVKR